MEARLIQALQAAEGFCQAEDRDTHQDAENENKLGLLTKATFLVRDGWAMDCRLTSMTNGRLVQQVFSCVSSTQFS